MEVQTLIPSSPLLEVKLPQLLRLARQVFEPEIQTADHNVPSKAPQLQMERWRERMNLSDAAFFWVETVDSMNLEDTPQIRGFFFAHPRALPGDTNSDQRSAYHIYLAAIHPSARGKGIFPLLLGATKAFAQKVGYGTLTVSTIPDKFPRMYSILSKDSSGWTVLQEQDIISEEGAARRKVLMKMSLSRKT